MAADPTEITDSEITGLLKRAYSDFRTDTFPQVCALLASLKKGKRGGPGRLRWTGEGIRGDAILTRPLGMTASQGGFFPSNHIRKERQFELGIRRLYVTRELDGLTIVGTKDPKGAYISIVKKALQEMKDAAKLGMQEILHGDGKAIKGVITTATSATSIVIQSPFGLAGSGEGGLLVDEGLEIAIIDVSAGNAVLGRARIQSVANVGDSATLTLVAPGIAGNAVGDFIVSCTASDTAFNQNPHGLLQILNRGAAYNSFLNIDAAVDPRWNATTLVAGTDTPSAARVTDSDIWRLMEKVGKRSGYDAKEKGDDFLLLTTPGLQLRIMETYLGSRVLNAKDMMDIPGGFKAIRVCGVPLISDHYCPAGTVYLLHLPTLTWVDAKDFGFISFEGAGPWRWIDGRDAYQTSWGAYLNVGTRQRNAHGMITGYDDTERFSHVM
jgi:hypothetical protein